MDLLNASNSAIIYIHSQNCKNYIFGNNFVIFKGTVTFDPILESPKHGKFIAKAQF